MREEGSYSLTNNRHDVERAQTTYGKSSGCHQGCIQDIIFGPMYIT